MAVHEREVRVPAGRVSLVGDLAVPDGASGLVVFAHGSGSSRHSPRNRTVAAHLQARGFATLALDLLTPGEGREDDRTHALRFDVALLGARVVAALDWLPADAAVTGLPVGLFGASTGAAAALLAAAARPDAVAAVVSRGGRPDLAADRLADVRAPTLLVVGGGDGEVLALNEQAAARLSVPHEVVVVPGATHLFEEPGALEAVSAYAASWFGSHLGTG